MAKTRYPVGSGLIGTVVHHAPFGVFLDVGVGHVRALLEIVFFADWPDIEPGGPAPAQRVVVRYPELGEGVTATGIAHYEANHQVYVSAKPALARDG
jgi:hypothetical protein